MADSKGDGEEEDYMLYVKNLDTGEDVKVDDALQTSFRDLHIAESKDGSTTGDVESDTSGGEYENDSDYGDDPEYFDANGLISQSFTTPFCYWLIPAQKIFMSKKTITQ